MKENVTYGECLAEILKALDIKCSRLAREINIDSSLVYKWLRNERIPPYDSLYIELILNFLSKKIVNPFQKKSIIDLLANNGIELPDTSDVNILNSLKRMLEHSQGYSIKLHSQMKSNHKICSKIAPEISAAGNHISATNKNIVYDFDNVQIVKGSLEVTCMAADLLARAPKKPLPNDNTILITVNNDLRLQLFTRDIYHVFIKTLRDLLNNGWECILNIMLDKNEDRSVKIIEGIQTLLVTGKLSIYYRSGRTYETANETDLLIIPQSGALLSFPTQTNEQTDSAFLFHSSSSIEILSYRFFKNLNSSRPLLRPFPSQTSAEFQKAFVEYEEAPGEKCVFKEGLSTITIPMDLYEKYLLLSGITSQELAHRTYLHKRRLDAFNEHIKHYKFRDICFIEAIVDLVDNKNYSFDEKYLMRDHAPKDSDIVCHLEYLAHLLETCDNYNVAFVSEAHFLNVKNINWMVKNGFCVLIETNSNGCTDFPDHDINFLINEKSIVNAFYDYFNIVWNNIPEDHKNKKTTIQWLRSLIRKCSGRTD